MPAAHQNTISTTPKSRKPIPMTSGGPIPNQESPDSEFSGFERSMHDLTNSHEQDERRRSAAPRPTKTKFLTLLVSSRR